MRWDTETVAVFPKTFQPNFPILILDKVPGYTHVCLKMTNYTVKS